jgi:hypothetical protein
VSKSSDKLEEDHATHFKSWIEKPIARNSIWKCSYAEDIMEGGQWCDYCLQWMEINNRGMISCKT